MTYREPLPECCSPDDAEEITTPRILYRLVRSNPPTDNDFRSQRAERPTARFNVSECQARGVSVYVNFHDAERQTRRPKLKGLAVCKLDLTTRAGRIRKTGGTSHHTWWPYADYDILANLPNGEFMKIVKLNEVLEYYDGILLFAACDPIGGNYLCEAIDAVGDYDRYAVVGVRPERMADFRAGQVDLRTLMLESPGGEWYITAADGAIDDPLVLEPQHKPLTETEYLPGGDDYFLSPEETPDGGTIRRALERGKVVTLTGLVEQANCGAGEWALLTEEGIQSGRTYPGGPGLDGLQVGKRYRFKCAPVTKLDSLSRDKQTLYLHHVENV